MNNIDYIRESLVFEGLDKKPLLELAASAQTVELHSGQVLYRYGDQGSDLFIVASGRLHLSAPEQPTPGSLSHTSTAERFVAEVGRGESIGKVGFITSGRRTVTARAIRDSVLIKLSKTDIETVLMQHPASMMRITRQIVIRLQHSLQRRARGARLSTRTITVIPATPDIDGEQTAISLNQIISQTFPTLKVDIPLVNQALGESSAEIVTDDVIRNSKITAWLNGLEARYRYLVYQADADSSAWTQRCLRQADRVLVVVRAGSEPAVTDMLRHLRGEEIHAPVELVILADDQSAAVTTDIRGWRAMTGAMAHHHVTHDNAEHWQHLSRMITGRAVGLVLGGGGARGFAHLGLLKALKDKGLAVDTVGGSSMGAYIGALIARGMMPSQVIEIVREAFVRNNYLNDYSFSRLSLIRAKKFRQMLEEVFGEMLIEETQLPYFCVTTNLSKGQAVVHDSGRLSSWVGASMTVPGIAPPVVYQGDLLVDGGLINSLPSDIMQDRGRGLVIASDVSAEPELHFEGMGVPEPEQLERKGLARDITLFKLLFRTTTLVSQEQAQLRAANADCYLAMPVADVGMFDWERMDEVIERAYDFASKQLDDFMSENSLKSH